ncbi:MAG: hypothetical protein Q4F72_10865 [Desulfovibrionaceae bacterium]|nr:hypothetical protein [Desulfovibrionaceae bacterium]
MFIENYRDLEELVQVGSRILVSNCHGKCIEGSPMRLVGRYYPDATATRMGKGIMVFPQRGTSLQGEYKETWEVEVARVWKNCLFARWIRKVGNWDWSPEFIKVLEDYYYQRKRIFGGNFVDFPRTYGPQEGRYEGPRGTAAQTVSETPARTVPLADAAAAAGAE